MTPTQYEALRDELVELLRETQEIDPVALAAKRKLADICKKTLENQFYIVIVGEFQGGKSTTFNALCDGRELSPRGAGIKTSGCIITVQNISTPTEPETAIVEWRDPEALIAGFSDLLLPQFKRISPNRFSDISASELAATLDIENPRDRQLIQKAADAEWKVWESDKMGYDREQRGKLDILCFASIVACHYGSEALNRHRERREFSVEDIGKLIVFPSDWTERWKTRDASVFSMEEIAFSFISHVQLKIHSDNLKRIGCVVMDCPGLSASRWDTGIARKAMFDADAILYLFDGAKTIKMSDLRELLFIQNNRMEHKLFYGCNMRGHSQENSRRIVNATLTTLKNNGFELEKDDITLFHALLALRTIQAERLISSDLNGHTIDLLSQGSSPPTDVRQKLHKDILRLTLLLDIEEKYSGIDAPSLEFARKASGFDELIGNVEKTVIHRKAKAILIDRGAQKGVEYLLEAEGELKHQEKLAFETEKDFLEQTQKAEYILKKFNTYCEAKLRELDNPDDDAALAENGWRFIHQNRRELYDYISKRLFEEISSTGFRQFFFGRKQLEDKIDGIVREAIDGFFETYMMIWMSNVKEGKNLMYNDRIAGKIRKIDHDIRTNWLEFAASEKDFLNGITIPHYRGELAVDSETFLQELDKKELFQNSTWSYFLKAWGIGFVAFGAAIGIGTLIRLIHPVVALISLIVYEVLGGKIISEIVHRTQKEMFHQRIRQMVIPSLDEFFLNVESQIRNHFQHFISDIRNLYRKGFMDAVNKPRSIFEDRKKRSEIDFKKSIQQRKKIANEARFIREQKIRPIRQKLEAFVRRTESCFESKEIK